MAEAPVEEKTVDIPAPTGDGNALVVYGSTGRRVFFTKDDLVMPESMKLRAEGSPWFAKQWDSVAQFWIHRILNESKLQHLTIPEVVARIAETVTKRWEHRKSEKKVHKKQKRLLEQAATMDNPAMGLPSRFVLVTNFCTLEEYHDPTKREDILCSILDRIGKHGQPVQMRQLVDDTPLTQKEDAAEPDAKKQRVEQSQQPSAPEFDDRVALLYEFASENEAAKVIAKLHGQSSAGRQMMCKFHFVADA